MAGGSIEHSRIVNNLFRAIDPLIGPDCEAHLGNTRAATPSGLYTYPDLMIVCGPPQLVPNEPTSVTNPVVIAEVLSKSTADYDRGEKFRLYRTIPTLCDYLVIDQYRIDVEHRWRDGSEWPTAGYVRREDEIALTGVTLTLRVGALYDRLSLPDTIPA